MFGDAWMHESTIATLNPLSSVIFWKSVRRSPADCTAVSDVYPGSRKSDSPHASVYSLTVSTPLSSSTTRTDAGATLPFFSRSA
uniref:Uncharacterized protein n=1 Tax=uncultured marine virus TaxID=186617 RepID=A0A0F7L429_9VIRU|nr:hypothetical protein [uncultured marine virus]